MKKGAAAATVSKLGAKAGKVAAAAAEEPAASGAASPAAAAMAEPRAGALFGRLDRNGSGSVNKREFAIVLRKDAALCAALLGSDTPSDQAAANGLFDAIAGAGALEFRLEQTWSALQRATDSGDFLEMKVRCSSEAIKLRGISVAGISRIRMRRHKVGGRAPLSLRLKEISDRSQLHCRRPAHPQLGRDFL